MSVSKRFASVAFVITLAWARNVEPNLCWTSRRCKSARRHRRFRPRNGSGRAR